MLHIRLANSGDLSAMHEIMRLAIDELQADFLSPEEVKASHAVMGLDTQLVIDRTYFVVEADGQVAGCGGWSRRATLYGGDHSLDLREPRLLDPASEAARVRAMYTHPLFKRRGVGRLVLSEGEKAAATEGFGSVELMATLAGVPLYRACGYREIEHTSADVDGTRVPLIRMTKDLDPLTSSNANLPQM